MGECSVVFFLYSRFVFLENARPDAIVFWNTMQTKRHARKNRRGNNNARIERCRVDSQRQPTPYENPIYRSTRNHFSKTFANELFDAVGIWQVVVFSYYIFKTLAIVHDASARQRAQVLTRWRERERKKYFFQFYFLVRALTRSECAAESSVCIAVECTRINIAFSDD